MPITSGDELLGQQFVPDEPAAATEQENETITAAVLSDDPLAAESAMGYLRSAPGIRLAPQGRAPIADVILVVTTVLTEQLLDRVKKARDASVAPPPCIALICVQPSERLLALAFRYGVVSMVPRETATRESIVSAVLASGHGGAVLSSPTVRWLADASRDFQDVAYTAHGVTAGGLTVREADVVRLLAEGLSTTEISIQLNYAERTIKNIIRDLLGRHHLRNRAHAVAFAFRAGAI